MPKFVDFQAVKDAVSLEDAVAALGLVMKPGNNQLRGACPVCKGGGDRALVITPGKGWYCFSAKKGGDQIALVAHIKDLPVKDAAEWLGRGIVPDQGTVPDRKSTVPESGGGEETQKLQPLSYLEPEHDAVVAVGFDPDFCKRHGIGYAGKGMMRGTVAIPFRNEHGTLIGYIGVEECRLPPDFTPNVVPFKKSA